MPRNLKFVSQPKRPDKANISEKHSRKYGPALASCVRLRYLRNMSTLIGWNVPSSNFPWGFHFISIFYCVHFQFASLLHYKEEFWTIKSISKVLSKRKDNTSSSERIKSRYFYMIDLNFCEFWVEYFLSSPKNSIDWDVNCVLDSSLPVWLSEKAAGFDRHLHNRRWHFNELWGFLFSKVNFPNFIIYIIECWKFSGCWKFWE